MKKKGFVLRFRPMVIEWIFLMFVALFCWLIWVLKTGKFNDFSNSIIDMSLFFWSFIDAILFTFRWSDRCSCDRCSASGIMKRFIPVFKMHINLSLVDVVISTILTNQRYFLSKSHFCFVVFFLFLQKKEIISTLNYQINQSIVQNSIRKCW